MLVFFEILLSRGEDSDHLLSPSQQESHEGSPFGCASCGGFFG